jgi:hypothetical protein
MTKFPLRVYVIILALILGGALVAALCLGRFLFFLGLGMSTLGAFLGVGAWLTVFVDKKRASGEWDSYFNKGARL